MVTTGINKLAAGLRASTWSGLMARGEERAPQDLPALIKGIRQRWRLRLLLGGLVWLLALFMLQLILFTWLLNHWYFSNSAIWLLRLVGMLGGFALVWQFFVKPLKRSVSDARVALYLEEQEPALGAILLSAVDARESPGDLSAQLVDGLVERALQSCKELDYGRAIEQPKLLREGANLTLVMVFCVTLLAFPPEFLRNGWPVLLMPWTNPADFSPYRVELEPGNIEIARGSDQLVSARVTGFNADQALLSVSDDDGNSWREIAMTAGAEPGVYESFLFDLDRALDYSVKVAGLQSERYRIEVADIAGIAEISLRYHFPSYTRLAPRTTQGSGDINALRGTRVEVQIQPTIPIPGGELVLDDGRRIALIQQDSGGWAAEIMVAADSSYRVGLQRASGKRSDESAEFRITALEDKYPSVAITSPGRDLKVSLVEEALMQVRAEDDQGIAQLAVMLRVNGGDEQRVDLMPAAGPGQAKDRVDAEHVVYLEHLGLRPGDLISYYVQAQDVAQDAPARSATSDIFFLQLRPFSNNYLRADQQGGGGGGGGQGDQQEGFLADQQRQFVVATFKMIRDRNSFSTQVYNENLELLSRAQARIRDRVEAIMRRISGRAMVQSDDAFSVITEELPLAASAMIEVEQQLQLLDIHAALSDAQRALQHLQRADAAFRDISVALNNQGAAGGGNNAANNELADLFKLEMDKLRNQYETVQRGQQQSAEALIDETLERLKELARRQQQSLEQSLRGQDKSRNQGLAERQLALAEELEEMLRQLERLTREQQNSQLQQSMEQMRAAAEAMRQAAANGNAGAAGQAREAAQKLQQAQNLLDRSRVQQFSEELAQAMRRAERAEQQQSEIKQQVFDTDNAYSAALEAQIERLEADKQTLTDELQGLEAELSQLTTNAREQQPQAAESLKQALRSGREFRLQDRIQRSKNMLLLDQKKHALENEIEIQRGIGSMREHLADALEQVREPGNRALERSLERMRSLARELQFLRERAAHDAADQASASEQASGPASGSASASGPATGGGWAGGGFPWMQQSLENISIQAGELQSRLLTQGLASGDLVPVLAALNALAQQDPQLELNPELQDRALAALMGLEYKLRTQLEGGAIPDALIAETLELPAAYRDLVAEYFRNLSRAPTATDRALP